MTASRTDEHDDRDPLARRRARCRWSTTTATGSWRRGPTGPRSRR